MNGSPQFSELSAAMVPVCDDPRVLAWLRQSLGINAGAFRYPPTVGVARIAPQADGTYRPDPAGEVRAVILPAQPPSDMDDLGRHIDQLFDLGGDLVAFDATNPARWWMRFGKAAVLNPEPLDRAAYERTPARLFASPLEWMRVAGAGGILDCTAGSVILDWNRAAAVLAGLDAIECGPHLVDALNAVLRPLHKRPELIVWQEAA